MGNGHWVSGCLKESVVFQQGGCPWYVSTHGCGIEWGARERLAARLLVFTNQSVT